METQKLMNEQINHEMESAYVYLSMSAYFELKNLKGMAARMKNQANEEMVHAMKFFTFMQERGWKIELLPIPKPKNEWATALEVFEAAYLHEKKISALINALMAKSIEEKDYPSSAMLQWFVTEQVEEESSAAEIVDKLKMIGDHKPALLMIDRELGARK